MNCIPDKSQIFKFHYFSLLFCLLLISCEKEKYTFTEKDKVIRINDNIFINNGTKLHDTIFNLLYYDQFLKQISTSPRILIVPSKDFDKTTSKDKVILTMRYDVDWDIKSAVRFAYREHKYGIRSSYYILHTAGYYGKISGNEFFRNNDLLDYMRKIQDDFGQEIGIHNDLITLGLVYGLSPKKFLSDELFYLRINGINIFGTTYHGSKYCYYYNYSNAYFWKDYPDNINYTLLRKGMTLYPIEKDSMKNYNLEYEGGLLKKDYFFADVDFINGKRWNMSMINLDTIQPGKKVIILLHPEYWN